VDQFLQNLDLTEKQVAKGFQSLFSWITLYNTAMMGNAQELQEFQSLFS